MEKKLVENGNLIFFTVWAQWTLWTRFVYSVDTMEKFYQGAYNLFQQQEYRKAADAFVFPTTLNPF